MDIDLSCTDGARFRAWSPMALHVLAYNMKHVIQILGVAGLMAAMGA